MWAGQICLQRPQRTHFLGLNLGVFSKNFFAIKLTQPGIIIWSVFEGFFTILKFGHLQFDSFSPTVVISFSEESHTPRFNADSKFGILWGL